MSRMTGTCVSSDGGLSARERPGGLIIIAAASG
jgi:hypothetical protein